MEQNEEVISVDAAQFPHKHYLLQMLAKRHWVDVSVPLVQENLSEPYARFVVETLQSLVEKEWVTQKEFDAAVEHLFGRAEYPRTFSFTRLYSLLSCALGYGSYVDARSALNRGLGKMRVLPFRKHERFSPFVNT